MAPLRKLMDNAKDEFNIHFIKAFTSGSIVEFSKLSGPSVTAQIKNNSIYHSGWLVLNLKLYVKVNNQVKGIYQ